MIFMVTWHVYVCHKCRDTTTASVSLRRKEARYMSGKEQDLSSQDYSYIELIRRRLWCENEFGRAAVMVGSGFSRNALRISETVPVFPLWGDLALSFYRALYPLQANQGNESHKARKVTNSGALSIAQEYEAAFGRQALEERILEMIPDLQYIPSDLHQRLLSLPWSDVFTTNYDTLLERTKLEIPDRKYDCVRSVSDIPVAMEPRIVKLHGSFPSQRPFIVTTEDYRTYPYRFAPFVNMVQQSMMENIFCLLGFSGDDPNFLNWIGWVRDNLQEHAPVIFLCGVLELSPSERKLLSERNIALIDLSPKFPKEEWQDPVSRHQAALEWFLDILHAGRPTNPFAWPLGTPERDSNRTDKDRFLIQPNSYIGLTSEFPTKSNLMVGELIRCGSEWKEVREHYPGWVITPRTCRDTIWSRIKYWITPVLNSVNEKLAGEKRINVLWELNWLLERSLTPLMAEWVEKIKEAIQSEVPFRDLVKEFQSADQKSNCVYNCSIDQGQWVDLAFAVLKHYRRVNDEAQFGFWSKLLEKVSEGKVGWKARFCYEQCIYYVYRFEYEQIFKYLQEWPQASESLFWETRKASILIEVGELERAAELVEVTLKEIRSRQQPCQSDYALLSQEGWTMFLLKAIKDGNLMLDRDIYAEFRDRWYVLRSYHCDPWPELDPTNLQKELEDEEPVHVEKSFDPKSYSRGFRFSSGPEISRYRPFLQLLMLFEEAGIPFRCGRVSIRKNEIANAAGAIYPVFPLWSLTAILRIGDTRIISEMFTRARVGSLEARQVEHLSKLLVQGIDAIIGGSVNSLGAVHNGYQVQMLSTLTESLSRLCIRLDDDQLSSVLELAQKMYVSPVFTRSYILQRCLRNLFKRILSFASDRFLRQHINALILLPIPGDNGFGVALEEWWPEPFDYIDYNRLRSSPLNREQLIIAEQADRLILLSNSKNRGRALSRLRALYYLDLLSNEQVARFARSLWSRVNEKTGLPDAGVYPLALVLKLPSPPDIDPKREFLEYIRKGVFATNVKKTDHGLSVSGGSADHFKISLVYGVANFLCLEAPTRVTMTREDKKKLLDKWADWWENEKHALKEHDLLDTIRHELKTMMEILTLIIMPDLKDDSASRQNIIELIEDMQKYSVIMDQLVPFRLLYDMEETNANELLVDGLNSGDDERVRKALAGIYYWYMGHESGIFPSPPSFLLDLLVTRVLMRITPCLDLAIDYLSVLFSSDSE